MGLWGLRQCNKKLPKLKPIWHTAFDIIQYMSYACCYIITPRANYAWLSRGNTLRNLLNCCLFQNCLCQVQQQFVEFGQTGPTFLTLSRSSGESSVTGVLGQAVLRKRLTAYEYPKLSPLNIWYKSHSQIHLPACSVSLFGRKCRST